MRRIKGTHERDRGRPAGTDPKCLHDSSRSCRRPDGVGGAPAGVRTPGCVWGALAPRLHDSLCTETSCRALVARSTGGGWNSEGAERPKRPAILRPMKGSFSLTSCAQTPALASPTTLPISPERLWVAGNPRPESAFRVPAQRHHPPAASKPQGKSLCLLSIRVSTPGLGNSFWYLGGG